ncbi:hypothetical protein [Pseudonocardia oroxyli]|uniref:hypothetical protein n=1 Tax=Pseudonocardia oroxyli TaxID=366584 RepID=UPI000B813A64|nr:hypothetical protein [Pseudonocardia oroxyli]
MSGVLPAEDCHGGELHDLADRRLLELGGPLLVVVAHDIARAYVDRAYPDDDEFRRSGYLASLWQTVELNEQ